MARAGELKEELYLIYISPSNPWPGISGEPAAAALASQREEGQEEIQVGSAPGTRPRRTVRG